MLLDFEACQLRNFRCIQDSGKVRIAPFTLFVGCNGSGKSSFLRFFQMLQQSISVNKRAPLLFYGSEVDFGDFRTAKSVYTDEDYMSFGFTIRISTEKRRVKIYKKDSIVCDVKLCIKHSESKESTYLSSVICNIGQDKIVVEFCSDRRITSMTINSKSMPIADVETALIPGRFILPILYTTRFMHPVYTDSYFGSDRIFVDEIYNSISNIVHGNTSDAKIHNKAMSLVYDDFEGFAEGLSYSSDKCAVINTSKLQKSDITNLRNLVIGSIVPQLFAEIDNALLVIASGVTYVGPLRASAERYYRDQELGVEKIDPKGANVPVFLNSLSRPELESLRKWVGSFFPFFPKKHKEAGHISVDIDFEVGQGFNLADVGFGYSQMLPVLIQLWNYTRQGRKRLRSHSSLFAIEQPELHLHPGYQARLVNAMVAASGRYTARPGATDSLKMLIETHSETIINQFGMLIAQKKLRPKDVAIYIFDNSAGPATVQMASYDESGVLKNWPFGFFYPGE